MSAVPSPSMASRVAFVLALCLPACAGFNPATPRAVRLTRTRIARMATTKIELPSAPLSHKLPTRSQQQAEDAVAVLIKNAVHRELLTENRPPGRNYKAIRDSERSFIVETPAIPHLSRGACRMALSRRDEHAEGNDHAPSTRRSFVLSSHGHGAAHGQTHCHGTTDHSQHSEAHCDGLRVLFRGACAMGGICPDRELEGRRRARCPGRLHPPLLAASHVTHPRAAGRGERTRAPVCWRICSAGRREAGCAWFSRSRTGPARRPRTHTTKQACHSFYT